jgi:hypothetical protein
LSELNPNKVFRGVPDFAGFSIGLKPKKAEPAIMTQTLVTFGSPAFRPYLAIGLALINYLLANYHACINVSIEFINHFKTF